MPGQINILEIIRLWNFAKSLDMVEFAKMRYNLLGNGGHRFPGLNAASLSEHDLRPCLARSPFAGRIINGLAEAQRMLAGEERKRLGKD